MSVAAKFRQHAFFLTICFLWMLVCDGLLYAMGIAVGILLILNMAWIVLIVGYFILQGLRAAHRKKKIENMVHQLDQKYLLQEVLETSQDEQERFFAYLLRIGNKSMVETISGVRREQKEYQEYIEQWVHEIKTPIAALKLQCENIQDKRKREMLHQLERVEHYVEQTLFYARSETVEKDARIQTCDLQDCCSEALLQCKYLCTSAQLQVHFGFQEAKVRSDEKWIIFILNQLIENAVKYRKPENVHLYLYITQTKESVTLHVQDTGCGIPPQDQKRIFEKGFTGENGRNRNRHATGIGLYLCQKLCTSLQIQLAVRSKAGVFTDVMLTFTS